MRLINYSIRLGMALLVLTVIGQIQINNRSLESRYHETVNSREFQEAYWAVMTPVTFAYSKLLSSFKKDSQTPMAR